MLRSFVAVELPAEIQSAIANSTALLQKELPKPLIRWVAPNNIHLTLKFLGDISPANLERLVDELKVEALDHETFTLSVSGLGAFPTPNQARTLWIGIDAPFPLIALVRGVETVAARWGYALENRPFSPHLTIGRVGQKVSGNDRTRIRTALERTTVDDLGTLNVNALHVFKSDLQPGGPVYSLLYTLPLKPAR